MKDLTTLIRREIESLGRDSSITKVTVDALTSIDEQKLCNEYDQICPIISTLVKAAMEKEDWFGPRILIYGIMFKARYPSSRACLITHW